MILLIVQWLVVLVISFASTPTLGGGWLWDTANALGIAAIVCLLYLTLTPHGIRHLKRHEQIGYIAVYLVIMHTLGMLFSDGAVIEYISPTAPAYMWTGILALLLLFINIISSLIPTRQAWYKNHKTFKLWHRGIAVLATALAAHHVLASGLYFRHPYQITAFVVLLFWVCFSSEMKLSPGQNADASPGHVVIASLVGCVIFVLVRNLL